MEKICIDFYDYSPVSDYIISENGIDILSGIYPDEKTESELIASLCEEINLRIRKSQAKNIYFINSSSELTLFLYFQGKLWTQGYVGVIEIPFENVLVTINFKSRFDKKQSFFLTYVFSVAFDARGYLFNQMNISGTNDMDWDFLLMILFAKQSHNAFKKGMYRQYHEYDYNDSNVRGRIDISRHLKENPISNGRICYTTREYTVDNPVNLLVLKAVEKLKTRYKLTFNNFLSEDEYVKKGLISLYNDVPDWKMYSDRDILKQTKKKVVHSVYKNYEALRKTSIAIIKRSGINPFENSSSEISGIIIDMPKLWEDFLIKELLLDIDNGNGVEGQKEIGIILDKNSRDNNSKRVIKPDFLLDKFVFDAKYKKHWGDAYLGNSWTGTREDVFQVLSYMHVLDRKIGGVIFPVNEKRYDSFISEYDIAENKKDEKFLLIPYFVPDSDNSVEYIKQMKENQKKLINEIKSYL